MKLYMGLVLLHIVVFHHKFLRLVVLRQDFTFVDIRLC